MDRLMRTSQSGFTIIELMVAMILTLLVLGGVYQTMLTSQQSYEVSRSNQVLVDKNRMSLMTLRMYLQQTGYRTADQVGVHAQQLFDEQNIGIDWVWNNLQVIQGIDNTASLPNAVEDSDTIAIRFFGDVDNDVFRCDGTTVADGVSETLVFYVSQVTSNGQTENWLTCIDSNNVPERFEQGIELLQVQYSSRRQALNSYLTAAEVDASLSLNWLAIDTIRLGMLVAQERPLNLQTNSQSYQVLDEDVDAANDYNTRQVIVETILLHNKV